MLFLFWIHPFTGFNYTRNLFTIFCPVKSTIFQLQTKFRKLQLRSIAAKWLKNKVDVVRYRFSKLKRLSLLQENVTAVIVSLPWNSAHCNAEQEPGQQCATSPTKSPRDGVTAVISHWQVEAQKQWHQDEQFPHSNSSSVQSQQHEHCRRDPSQVKSHTKSKRQTCQPQAGQQPTNQVLNFFAVT